MIDPPNQQDATSDWEIKLSSKYLNVSIPLSYSDVSMFLSMCFDVVMALGICRYALESLLAAPI